MAKLSKADRTLLEGIVEFGIGGASKFDLLLQAVQQTMDLTMKMATEEGDPVGALLLLPILSQLEDTQRDFRKVVRVLQKMSDQRKKKARKTRKTAKASTPQLRLNLN